MYTPNFILIGKPYTPEEEWQRDLEAKLEQLRILDEMATEAKRKIEMKRIWSQIEQDYQRHEVVAFLKALAKLALVVGAINIANLVAYKIVNR